MHNEGTHDELELLTIAELADLWRVSKRTIQKRIASGEIPSLRLGHCRRIRAVDAARFLASRSRGGPTP